MKVILLNPNTYLEDIMHPPIGLAILATLCEGEGHDVEILDLPISGMSDESAVEWIIERGAAVVGFTVTTKIFASAARIASGLKRVNGGITTVMGGPHPTFAGRTVLERCPQFDYVFAFEAEYSFPEFLSALESHADVRRIPGVGSRAGAEIVINQPADPIPNLNELPIAKRTYFPMDRYLERDNETTLLTARGCPNSCAFCSTSRMGRQLRMRSPENVGVELRSLIDMGFRSIFVSDDTFTTSIKRVDALCKEFAEVPGDWRWTCNMRLSDARQEILRPMKESGCYRVFVGVESSSTKILGRINKRCPATEAVELCRMIKAFGIEVHASFLLGLPGETEGTIWNTVGLAKEMKPDMISFNVLTPYPGTLLYERPEEYGIVMPDPFWFEKADWFRHPVCGTKDVSPERLFRLAIEAYTEFVK